MLTAEEQLAEVQAFADQETARCEQLRAANEAYIETINKLRNQLQVCKQVFEQNNFDTQTGVLQPIFGKA